MTISDFDPKSPHPVATVLRRIAGPIKVATSGGAMVARKVPPTIRAARAGTRTAAVAIEGLSDSSVRWLTASSIGLGAGFYLSGKRKLAVVAGLAPVLLAAASMESGRLPHRLPRSRSGGQSVELPTAEV